MSGIKRFFAVDKDRAPKKAKTSKESNVHEQPKESAASKNQSLTNEKAHSPPKPKDEVIDSANSDSDVEMVDHKPAQALPKKAKPKTDLKPSANNRANPKQSKPASKPSTKAAAKSHNEHLSSDSSSGQSVEEILASIPSPELPDVDDSSKPNFRQIMQQKSEPSDYGSANLDINAAPNCLTGLTFVVTGQLPSLGREQVQSLIKQYGGNVTGSISGRTSCLVLGEEAGPSKIQKAKKLKSKVLDEDGFLELLRRMPAEGGDSQAAERARLRRKREEQDILDVADRLKKTDRVESEHAPLHQRKGGASNSKSSHAPESTDEPESGDIKEMWTRKYAPRSLDDMVGNSGPIRKLANWSKNWHSSKHGGGRAEGNEYRAAMSSGPPGIGKTTAAHLSGKLEGYDVVEYNASDTRSKSLSQSNVAQTLNNSTVGIGSTNKSKSRKLLVIMDEVDGMSAGDRGGVGAMAALARTANVPLILICNERTLPKMRPFDRCVFDSHFRRPDASQIRPRLMSIAHVEGLHLDANAVEQSTQATHSDIRQMSNLLETYRTTQKSMSYDKSRSFAKSWNKEVVLKPFDIAARLSSRASQNSMTTSEKMELYFHDYDFAPLMVQENYSTTAPSLAAAATAAESISDGDLVDKFIHGPQQVWSSMPLHDLTSCVIPSYAAAGQGRGRFNFTSYLGNNSKGLKYRRLLAELRSHMRSKIAASSSDIRLELQPLLAFLLLAPLLMKGANEIPEVISFMDDYFITKEDWDVVMESGVGPNNTEDMAKKSPTAVKSAFTRKYNAMSHPSPFMRSIDSKAAAVTGRKPETPDLEDVVPEEDGGDDEPQEAAPESLDDEVKHDKYIKGMKKRTKSGANTSKKSAPKRTKKAKK